MISKAKSIKGSSQSIDIYIDIRSRGVFVRTKSP